MFKRTYKIIFEKTYESVEGGYMEVRSNDLFRVIAHFCSEQNIAVKKIKIRDVFKKSFVKIRGNESEYQALYCFLTHPKMGEHIEVISPFKS